MNKHIIPFWYIETFLIILTLFHHLKDKFHTNWKCWSHVKWVYSLTNKQTNKQTFTCDMEPWKVTQTKEKNYWKLLRWIFLFPSLLQYLCQPAILGNQNTKKKKKGIWKIFHCYLTHTLLISSELALSSISLLCSQSAIMRLPLGSVLLARTWVLSFVPSFPPCWVLCLMEFARVPSSIMHSTSSADRVGYTPLP